MPISFSQKLTLQLALSSEILREIADAVEDAERGIQEPGQTVSVASVSCPETTVEFVHITEPRTH